MYEQSSRVSQNSDESSKAQITQPNRLELGSSLLFLYFIELCSLKKKKNLFGAEIRKVLV